MENKLAVGTNPVETPPTATKQHNATPMPNQNVYLLPITQQQSTGRPVPGVRCLSATQIIIGSFLVVLGIVAAVLQARGSYIGNPIWTGLLFFVVTGILGIFVYLKKTNLCMNIAYMVMCIIACVFAFQLMLVSWHYATVERHLSYYNEDVICYPSPGIYIEDCDQPLWARILVGVIIGFFALAALIISIISCNVTLYGTFNCCYQCCSCCRKTPTDLPYTVQYTPQGIVITSSDGNQVITPQIIPPTQALPTAPQQTMPPQPIAQSAPPAYVTVQPNTTTSGSTPVMSSEASDKVDQQNTKWETKPEMEDGKPLIETAVELTGEEEDIGLPGQVTDDPQDWQTFEK